MNMIDQNLGNITKHEEDDEHTYDFDFKENLLIEVFEEKNSGGTWNDTWRDHFIATCHILGENAIKGAATFEQETGYLPCSIETMIDCPGAGYFVVEGITGTISEEDRFRLTYENIRPATQAEVETLLE